MCLCLCVFVKSYLSRRYISVSLQEEGELGEERKSEQSVSTTGTVC